MNEDIEKKLEHLPKGPGVYLFKDAHGVIVYVGKAKSLRSRVRSYFQRKPSDTRAFLLLLDRVLGDIDTVVTATEKEAAILENELIKQHQPRFNVKLRDDKTFLSLRLSAGAWPKLGVVRRIDRDGARYFGPYHSATAARRTLHVVNKHFQLRTCTDAEMAARRRPCLQHQIKRCAAPCVYEVDRVWYAQQTENVALFLAGRHDELSAQLQAQMQDAAKQLRFELAAAYRDQLRAIEVVREGQRVVWVDAEDRDVIGLHREGDLAEIAVLSMRAGRLADVATYSVREVATLDEELIGAFVSEHYVGRLAQLSEGGLWPRELLLPRLPEGVDGIAEWLSEAAGRKVSLLCPQRGKKVELLAMANDNAKHAFDEKRRKKDDVELRLQQIKDRLRLPELPVHIECCDISHLGGKDTVGAVVHLTRGEPDKKRYRSFVVRGIDGVHRGGDDYGAMYEVLARRFRRGRAAREAAQQQAPAAQEEEQGWSLPDLLVVDGGRGQLGVALAAARDLGLHDLPIVGLAKEKENVLGEELVDRVYLPGQKNPIPLRSSAALMMLARARDEAHRFSNKIRERLGRARRLESSLDGVAGVGPQAKRSLLLAFSAVPAVFAASDEALLAVPGINRRHVRALRAHTAQQQLQATADADSPAQEVEVLGESEHLPALEPAQHAQVPTADPAERVSAARRDVNGAAPVAREPAESSTKTTSPSPQD